MIHKCFYTVIGLISTKSGYSTGGALPCLKVDSYFF